VAIYRTLFQAGRNYFGQSRLGNTKHGLHISSLKNQRLPCTPPEHMPLEFLRKAVDSFVSWETLIAHNISIAKQVHRCGDSGF